MGEFIACQVQPSINTDLSFDTFIVSPSFMQKGYCHYYERVG